MQAYLASVDLWLITNGAITRSAAAGEEQSRWNISNSQAIGMITLMLKDHIHQRLFTIISVAVPAATDHHASTWWTTLQMEYGTISPTQVYDLLKSSLNFCIDGSKHPHLQLDVLENIHVDLTTNGVELPDFFRSIMLLTCLPPAWETTIIQTVMA